MAHCQQLAMHVGLHDREPIALAGLQKCIPPHPVECFSTYLPVRVCPWHTVPPQALGYYRSDLLARIAETFDLVLKQITIRSLL